MAESRARKAPPDPVPAATPVPTVTASARSFGSSRADLAVCFAFEGKKLAIPGVAPSSALVKALSRQMRQEEFKGKRGQMIVYQSGGRYPAIRYLIAGLGKPGGDLADRVREATGMAVRRYTPTGGGRQMTVALPSGDTGEARAAAEGALLGAYRLIKYQHGEDAKYKGPRTVELVVGRTELAAARRGVSEGTTRGRAANLARDLLNEPAITLTPARMADVARRIARERGLEIKVHDKKALEKLGMGAILGVAAGSHQPPCLIHLTYRPGGKRRSSMKKLALVGKGLTFDSGGLSIKSASGMETMKLDKAGACNVLAVMSALADLKPDIEIHGIMGMTENMPGGSAIKPGDILRSASGKTIEVLNTDAEGRVVLADALHYAQQQKVDEIIDMATLTGACMVALGPTITGVLGNDQEMVNRFLAAAQKAGEKVWQLPLDEEYSDQVRSDIADVRNTPSTRYGGAITAGLFLKAFVDDGVPWIHLDIAGPAYIEKDRAYMRKGGTGSVVRTLLTYIKSSARD